MYRVQMRVDGMACGACVMKVTGCLEQIGAKDIRIDQASGATSFWTEKKPGLADIIHAVKKYDYRPFDISIQEEKTEQ